jgi:hypothetical protein
MSNLLGKLFNGNPFASITIAGILAVGGAYLTTHLDTTHLTPTGLAIYSVVMAVVGVLTHSTNKPTSTP